MNKKIVCFHLFNDYSGSPKVLKMVLQGMLDANFNVDLITSGQGGILDELKSEKNLKKISYKYNFSANKTITMLRYMSVQIYTFFMSFRYLLSKNTVFYINTLLPIGPALAGRLMRKRVIYHYHENAGIKGPFYKILSKLMLLIASEIICVSEYQRSFLNREKGITVIPNAVPTSFTKKLRPSIEDAFKRKSVLLIASLKKYKGIIEYVRLSHILEQYNFTLVVNDVQSEIDSFFSQNGLTKHRNLAIYPRQTDVTRFYNTASLVLNLTNKNISIETFGLTALEAMSAGLPVIVPTVGGIAELVENGFNGYKIDVSEIDKIAEQIECILSDKALYVKLATRALNFSRKFSENNMIAQIISAVNKNYN